MNPTAEDILNRRSREAGYLDFESLDSSVSTSLRTAFVITAMEEYSLLKSKEAASDGFDAGCKHGFDPEQFHSTADAKETYMKKYDTTGS